MGAPAKGPTLISDPDESSLGPAMRALNASQRRFVLAAMEYPGAPGFKVARAAGYEDNGTGAIRVAAHRLMHNELVIAAMQEEASKRLRGSAMMGVNVLLQIAQSDGHKDQLKAAEALLNRVGFHERHEQVVTHRDQTGEALIDQIKGLAERLGVPVDGLLGGRQKALAPPPVIDGEVEE